MVAGKGKLTLANSNPKSLSQRLVLFSASFHAYKSSMAIALMKNPSSPVVHSPIVAIRFTLSLTLT